MHRGTAASRRDEGLLPGCKALPSGADHNRDDDREGNRKAVTAMGAQDVLGRAESSRGLMCTATDAQLHDGGGAETRVAARSETRPGGDRRASRVAEGIQTSEQRLNKKERRASVESESVETSEKSQSVGSAVPVSASRSRLEGEDTAKDARGQRRVMITARRKARESRVQSMQSEASRARQ